MVGAHSKHIKAMSVLFLFIAALVPGIAYCGDMGRDRFECMEVVITECFEVYIHELDMTFEVCQKVVREVCN